MPRELRLFLIMAITLAVGLAGARTYARMMVPYYAAMGRLLAGLHTWQVQEVGMSREGPGGAQEVRLVAIVRKIPSQPLPALRVESTMDVGDVVQLPVIFWGILLAWRADTMRQLLQRLAMGVPVFLTLETVTTVCQLVGPMAEAAEYLNGNPHPVTAWEIWARLLETGGRQALAAVAALLIVAGGASRERLGRDQQKKGPQHRVRP